MSQLDILYRAFLDYRKITQEDEACAKMRQAVVRASADRDKVESQRTVCTIEEDWVCAIEEALPFVEKAIREERQFIRQRGEVVPIEKVRRVSTASVTHLARHGDMISRVPEEGEDLIPDELYMVENLTNYAVYENRFLYMLLCYLRDFIDLRYNKIIELGNTYKANLAMAKTVTIGKRTITFQTQFTDEYRNDPLSTMNSEARAIIRRIEDLQSVVAMLLATPLMKEVAHVPMLKPPITRTNALRMDNALRNSLALYDYVASYGKDGYTVDTIRKTFSPLPEVMADDFAETVSMTSFLVYEYCNDLKGELKDAYRQEELRRRDEAAASQRQRLDEMRQRLSDGGLSPEEYILQLEERNRYLEALRPELDQANEQIAHLAEEQIQLQKTIHDQEVRIRVHQDEIRTIVTRYESEMEEQNRAHQEEIMRERANCEALIEKMRGEFESEAVEKLREYEKEMAVLVEQHKVDMETAEERHENELREADIRYETDMTAAEERRVSEITELDERRVAELAEAEERRENEVSELNEKLDNCVQTYEASITELKDDYEEQVMVLGERACKAENELFDLRDKHLLQRAELRALRYQRGKDSNEEDFTSEERFKELVDELATLDAFIGTHWKRAKRRIRHRYLWGDEGT